MLYLAKNAFAAMHVYQTYLVHRRRTGVINGLDPLSPSRIAEELGLAGDTTFHDTVWNAVGADGVFAAKAEFLNAAGPPQYAALFLRLAPAYVPIVATCLADGDLAWLSDGAQDLCSRQGLTDQSPADMSPPLKTFLQKLMAEPPGVVAQTLVHFYTVRTQLDVTAAFSDTPVDGVIRIGHFDYALPPYSVLLPAGEWSTPSDAAGQLTKGALAAIAAVDATRMAKSSAPAALGQQARLLAGNTVTQVAFSQDSDRFREIFGLQYLERVVTALGPESVGESRSDSAARLAVLCDIAGMSATQVVDTLLRRVEDRVPTVLRVAIVATSDPAAAYAIQFIEDDSTRVTILSLLALGNWFAAARLIVGDASNKTVGHAFPINPRGSDLARAPVVPSLSTSTPAVTYMIVFCIAAQVPGAMSMLITQDTRRVLLQGLHIFAQEFGITIADAILQGLIETPDALFKNIWQTYMTSPMEQAPAPMILEGALPLADPGSQDPRADATNLGSIPDGANYETQLLLALKRLFFAAFALCSRRGPLDGALRALIRSGQTEHTFARDDTGRVFCTTPVPGNVPAHIHYQSTLRALSEEEAVRMTEHVRAAALTNATLAPLRRRVPEGGSDARQRPRRG